MTIKSVTFLSPTVPVKLTHVLTQRIAGESPSSEVLAVRGAAMLSADTFVCLGVSLEGLSNYAEALRAGSALPVGSVEFVREAFLLAGILEPANMTYPLELRGYLVRNVSIQEAGTVLGPCFVKPIVTKAFTGFGYDPFLEDAVRPSGDRQNYAAFLALAPSTPVWVSELVSWQSEWRYYIDDHTIIGEIRYDESGAHNALAPDIHTVELAAMQLLHDGPCTLDFGVLADGQTALVEVNDFWAIGLYSGALDKKVYFRLLALRWAQLLATRSLT